METLKQTFLESTLKANASFPQFGLNSLTLP